VLKRTKSLKLKLPPAPGKPFEGDEQARMLAVARASTLAAREACLRRARGERTPRGAKQGGSPCIYPALVVALNCGMRDAEIRLMTWNQIDLEKKFLTVGESKTAAGTGRTIPLNGTLLDALLEHSRWYAQQFGQTRPEWFIFPGGGRFPDNSGVAITTLKTAWAMVRRKAGVSGRWHDNRHTLITELAESGAGDETIMEIAGHVSRQILSRYSHIRMEAKRKALAEVDRQRAADKAHREKERAPAQTNCNGAPVANVAQTLPVQ
jgi:integrase